jgi:hypothetical protein
VIILALLLPVLVATVAYSATSSPGKSGSAPGKQKSGQQQSTEKETQDQGIPGGSITRFHGNTDVNCALPSGADALESNWNHGMYVEAWAATKDPTKIVIAAHSPCGKPMQAAFHGHFAAGTLPPGLAKRGQNQATP